MRLPNLLWSAIASKVRVKVGIIMLNYLFFVWYLGTILGYKVRSYPSRSIIIWRGIGSRIWNSLVRRIVARNNGTGQFRRESFVPIHEGSRGCCFLSDCLYGVRRFHLNIFSPSVCWTSTWNSPDDGHAKLLHRAPTIVSLDGSWSCPESASGSRIGRMNRCMSGSDRQHSRREQACEGDQTNAILMPCWSEVS